LQNQLGTLIAEERIWYINRTEVLV